MALTEIDKKYIDSLPKEWSDAKVTESLKKFRAAQSAKSLTPQYEGESSVIKAATDQAQRSLGGFINAGMKEQPLPEVPKEEGNNRILNNLSGIAAGGMEAVANLTTKPLGKAIGALSDGEISDNPTIAGVQKFGKKFGEELAGGAIEAYGSIPGVDTESEEFKGSYEPMKTVGAIGTGIAGGGGGKALGTAVASGLPKLGGFIGQSLGSTAGVMAGSGELPDVGDFGVGLGIDALLGSLGAVGKPLAGWVKGTKAYENALKAAGKETAPAVKSSLADTVETAARADVPSSIAVKQADVTGESLTKSGISTQDANTLKQIRNEMPPEIADYAEKAFVQAVKAADESLLKNVPPARDLAATDLKTVYKGFDDLAKQNAKAIAEEATRLGTQPQLVVSQITKDVADQFGSLKIKVGKNGKLNFKDSRLAGETFSKEQGLLNDIWDYLQPRKGAGGVLRSPDDLLVKVQNAFDRAKADQLYSTVYQPIKAFRDSAKTALEEMADSPYKQLAVRSAKLIGILDDLEGWFGKGAEKAANVLPRLQSRAVSTPEIKKLLADVELMAKEFGVKGAENLTDKATISILMDRLAGVKEPEAFVGQIERAITGAGKVADFVVAPGRTSANLILEKLAATPTQREAIEKFLAARESPEVKQMLMRPLADELDQVVKSNEALNSIPGFRIALKSFLLGGDEEIGLEEEFTIDPNPESDYSKP